jgi:myo-inositol 2-dehydrogenase / D-chiro-inositol 1-dehydrogenase
MKNKNNPALSRREFIRNSVLLAGGLATGVSLRSQGRTLSENAVRVAVIGCGGRGTAAVIQALKTSPQVRLVAMADAFRDRLDECYKNIQTADFHNQPESVAVDTKKQVVVSEKNKFTGFEGYKEAIALADVVILATPPGFRPLHFEEAVRQGKHVFMEKPVATDATGVRQVIAAAEEAQKKNLKVVVGLQRRYQNSYLETHKRILDGAIGEMVAANCWWNSGGVWVKERQPGMSEMEYQMRNWYYFNWLSGDHIVEQHIHNLDVINWFKGSYPVKAVGMGGRQQRTGKKYGEIFDHHHVEFEYADGMILNSQCQHFEGCPNQIGELFIGTKGKATEGKIMDLKGNVLWRHDNQNDPNPFQTEQDTLFDAILNNKPVNDAFHGARSTMTAILGRMATYSGQALNWEDAYNSTLSIMPQTFAWNAETPTKPDANGYYPVPVPGRKFP